MEHEQFGSTAVDSEGGADEYGIETNDFDGEKPFIKEEPEDSDAEEDDDYVSDKYLSNEPQEDVTVKTEPDSHSPEMDIPPSLANCTEEEIQKAFEMCYDKVSKTTPFLGKVFAILTKLETVPSLDELKYLHRLWLVKYKDLLGANTVVRKKRVKRSRLSRPPKKKTKSKFQSPKKLVEESVCDTGNDPSTMLEPNDIIIKTEPRANCPPSLQSFIEIEIDTAFRRCYNRVVNIQYSRPNSLFGKIVRFLTRNKTSTLAERRYLFDLWTQKYKHEFLDPRRAELKKFAKSNRRKNYRRICIQEETRLRQAVECVYDEISEPEDNTSTELKLKPQDLPSSEKSICSPDGDDLCSSNTRATAIVLPKVTTSMENDYSDHCSDISVSPPPSPAPIHNERLKDEDKKRKVVVKVKLLGPTELEETSIRRTMTRRKVANKKYDNDTFIDPSDLTRLGQREVRKSSVRKKAANKKYDNGSSSGPSNLTRREREPREPRKSALRTKVSNKRYDNDAFSGSSDLDDQFQTNDNDSVAAEDSDTLNFVPRIYGQQIDDICKDPVKSLCSVCGRQLSKNIMTFHTRTHFSYEDHKKYLIERREKYKEMKRNMNGGSVPKKMSSESRLDQLKRLLEGREKKVERNPQGERAPRIRPSIRKVNEKRDGNYGPVQCADCGKVICTIYALKKHEVQVHGAAMLPCEICGRSFAFREAVRKHLATHFNAEEQAQFITWTGSVEEFIERLNTGADLNKPPTRKKGWGGYRREGAPPRRLPSKKRGRPITRHHLYDKNNDNNSSGATAPEATSVQPQTSVCPESSNESVEPQPPGYINACDTGGQFQIGEMPSTSFTTVDSNSLNWNTYPNQLIMGSNYFAENRR